MQKAAKARQFIAGLLWPTAKGERSHDDMCTRIANFNQVCTRRCDKEATMNRQRETHAER
jgi:hypothetical protein